MSITAQVGTSILPEMSQQIVYCAPADIYAENKPTLESYNRELSCPSESIFNHPILCLLVPPSNIMQLGLSWYHQYEA